MPRLKRRHVRRSAGLTQAQREDLLDGMPVIEPEGPLFASPLERRALWHGLRDELMAKWDAEERAPFARPSGMIDYDLETKYPRLAITCTNPECSVRPAPLADHAPHGVTETDAEYLVRIGEATDLERGYNEAELREGAEREARFRRACEEYDEGTRARSEPRVVMPIGEGGAR